MARSCYKVPYFMLRLTKKIKKKSILISSHLIEQSNRIYVYNGQFYQKVILTAPKKGFKLGEFCWTKRLVKHKLQRQKSKKKVVRDRIIISKIEKIYDFSGYSSYKLFDESLDKLFFNRLQNK
jgi:ribosomal protein S19